MKKPQSFFLVILLFIAFLLRFYQLNWGGPFYFHPDERNIASSVSQLMFPKQLNPHFFAYGALPIYANYSLGIILNAVRNHPSLTVSFETAIIASRILSALLSLLCVYLIYLLAKKLRDEATGIFAATLAAVSSGLIQFAHFGTVESWLTFFCLLFFLSLLSLLEKISLKTVSLAGLIAGSLIAIKVSSLPLLILLPFTLIFANGKSKKPLFRSFMEKIFLLLESLSIAAILYVLTNPYTFLDYSSFVNSMHYESGVSLGTEHVFYTGEFYQGLPVLFQFLHIYPFLANPLLTILFIPSFFYLLFIGIKKKNTGFLLLCITYLVLFLSQAFLFTKWTRYIVPTLPFLYIAIGIALSELIRAEKIKKFMMGFVSIICTIFCLAFIVTVYGRTDTRVAAYQFAKEHLPSNDQILSEQYDLGIVPFNQSFSHITLFPFYDMDTGLSEVPPATPYIILPSQRIYKIRMQNAKKFPNGHRFYSDLFSGKSGYTKIYETPCDAICKIAYAGDPVFGLEETASVFDRPTVYIFKKR